MTSPLHERDGLDFRPQDGKTSERQFEIIAFMSGRAAPGHKQPSGLENPMNRPDNPLEKISRKNA